MEHDEFMDLIADEIEHQVDQLILAEPDLHDRSALMRRRNQIIRELTTATAIADLKRRLDERQLRVVA